MITVVRRFISSFLLVTFLFAAAPQEWIHQLAHHEDTVDVFHGDLQFSDAHRHCCTLQLSLPLFVGATEAVLPAAVFEQVIIDFRRDSCGLFSSLLTSLDRGPPMLA